MKCFKFVIPFLKKNIFSFACLLLSFTVAVGGSISYAKYISASSNGQGAGTGSFSVSASVDGISGLSFTNTAFWSSSDESDKIAMNALRSLDFSVNNFETDESGKQKVSDVKLKYTLSFSAPKSFATTLAMQVFNEDGTAALPQIVISDLINGAGGKYNTANSEDYNGTTAEELEFTVVKNSDTLYTATSGDTVILIEEYEKTTQQALLFRMWDTSGLTSESYPKMDVEGGKVVSPLELHFTQTSKFYRISVMMREFVLPAGTAKTVKHTVKLAPTEMVSDIHLGGNVVTVVKDSDGNIVNFDKVQSIYADGATTWYIQSMNETTTESYYDNSNFTGTPTKTTSPVETTVTGNVTIYKDGAKSETVNTSDTETVGTPETTVTETVENGEIAWSDFTIIGSEPTLSTYKTGYLAQTVREKNRYGTVFYIHKLNATRTGTQTVTHTKTEKTVTPIDTVQKQTEVAEATTVDRIDGENEKVLLNVTKTTTTKYVGNLKEETTTTTTTYNRTYTQKGYIYRGYYKDSNGNFRYWGDTVAKDNEEPLLEIKEDNTILTNTQYYIETMHVEEESHTDVKQSETNTPTVTSNLTETSVKSTEYIQKKIVRTYTYSEIVIDEAIWTVTDESGDMQTVTFDKSSPFEFFSDNIQKYYMAQCYSKSYPFFVNVIFEQTQ